MKPNYSKYSIDYSYNWNILILDIVKKILNIGNPISVIQFVSKNQSGGKRKKRTKRKRNNKKKTKRYKRY